MRGWIAFLAAAACATRSMPPPAPLSVPAAALAPVTGASAQLESIARRYWTALLDTAPLQLLGNGALGGPLFATALGDHRFGARLDDLSPDGHRSVIATLDELLRQDPSTSVFLPGEERFSGVPEAERRAARDRIRGTIVEQVLPGVRRYREFLAGELLQKARAEVGLWALPGGGPCYAALVAHHTGTKRTAQELHDLGLKTLAG